MNCAIMKIKRDVCKVYLVQCLPQNKHLVSDYNYNIIMPMTVMDNQWDKMYKMSDVKLVFDQYCYYLEIMDSEISIGMGTVGS